MPFGRAQMCAPENPNVEQVIVSRAVDGIEHASELKKKNNDIQPEEQR